MDADKIIASMEEYNKDISKWAYRVRAALKREIQSKATDGNGDLAKSLRTNTRKDMGEIDSVSYKFVRHGVFFQKGVGRGHVMAGNKVIRGVKDGKVIRYQAKEHGKVSKSLNPKNLTRTSKDWFNSTLDKEVEELANIVADHKADEAAVNAAGMKIH